MRRFVLGQLVPDLLAEDGDKWIIHVTGRGGVFLYFVELAGFDGGEAFLTIDRSRFQRRVEFREGRGTGLAPKAEKVSMKIGIWITRTLRPLMSSILLIGRLRW